MRFERLFLLVAFIVAAILPVIVRNEYLVHIGVIILFSVTMAASFNLIVGYIGEFPLGHTAFLGVGAYTAAILSTRLGLPIYATVPLGGVFSAHRGAFHRRDHAAACGVRSSSSSRCASRKYCGSSPTIGSI